MVGLGAGEAGSGTVPMHIRFVHIAFATCQANMAHIRQSIWHT